VVRRICPSRRSATTAPISQPQEQKRRQFVGPDDRAVEQIARDDAGKQDAGFGQHQHRAGQFDHLAYQHVDRERNAAHPAARKPDFCGFRYVLAHRRCLLPSLCR
jgi:hypothetical protein